MKTRILMVVMSLFMTVFSFAANELTPEQKVFQNSMKKFLREEGFSPTVDDVNSLTFKKEGELYWIDLGDSNPFYVEFHRIGFKCENSNRNYVLQACNEANRQVRCVKSFLGETSVSLVIESFCHSVEEFKYTFYKSLKELDKAYNIVRETYSNLDNGSSSYSQPFDISKIEVANVDKDNNIINGYGTTIYDFQTKYIKPWITVDVKTEGNYDIYVKFYSPKGLSSASDSPDGYTYKSTINMTSGSHTYTLYGWGSENKGNWSMGRYRLEFYYNGQRIAQKEFDIK